MATYELPPEYKVMGGKIVDAGFHVHSGLGPGLLESVYERCLVRELVDRGFKTVQQAPISFTYKGEVFDAGFRADIIVNDRVQIELKAVEAMKPIHEAQLLTYLKLSGLSLGYLLNFNVPVFKEGIKRFVRTSTR